jgi:hypothetical protein
MRLGEAEILPCECPDLSLGFSPTLIPKQVTRSIPQGEHEYDEEQEEEEERP